MRTARLERNNVQTLKILLFMYEPLPPAITHAVSNYTVLGATDMAGWCVATCWLAVAAAVILVFVFLRKIFLLLTGDADLTLLSKSLIPNFFRNKVVWVTGASSGSEISKLYTVFLYVLTVASKCERVFHESCVQCAVVFLKCTR